MTKGLSAVPISVAVACGWCVPSSWTQSFWQRRSSPSPGDIVYSCIRFIFAATASLDSHRIYEGGGRRVGSLNATLWNLGATVESIRFPTNSFFLLKKQVSILILNVWTVKQHKRDKWTPDQLTRPDRRLRAHNDRLTNGHLREK